MPGTLPARSAGTLDAVSADRKTRVKSAGPARVKSAGRARPLAETATTAVSVTLGVLVLANAWLAYDDHQARKGDDRRASMVQAARDGIEKLTNFDHAHVEENAQSILDVSTGEFRNDFVLKQQSFIDSTRKAQTTSVGTVTEAGLQSIDGDQGNVLITVKVMTSDRGVPEKAPHNWRARVGVVENGDSFKVAVVEFIR